MNTERFESFDDALSYAASEDLVYYALEPNTDGTYTVTWVTELPRTYTSFSFGRGEARLARYEERGSLDLLI